ncbi:holo-ACP synthase [Collinsella sp. zg1085]|uniref:holo-ACP synthase n=1 Tax=Collinsella sp. zg1085 TaxID=2844380 RepID=UPI001C0D8B30|nr:holo-ACP synthase [Collinsella sp. zg1085]QWT17708.1 holo-ACP synthase [Collinsella sp. zg1085]
MVTAGIGVDIVEIARMESIMHRTPRFLTRVFTEQERSYCETSSRPAAHYACRFAAREAVLKALGTGFSQGISFADVSVEHDAHGRPQVLLRGQAQEIAARQGITEIALSLSFTGEYAVANALAITSAVQPQSKEPVEDERTVIARSFKEVRSLIDELDSSSRDKLTEYTSPVDLSEQEHGNETRS